MITMRQKLCVFFAIAVVLVLQQFVIVHREPSLVLSQQYPVADASEIKMALLQKQNKELRQEIEELKKNMPTNSNFNNSKGQRDVVVPSMCRCSSGNLPVPRQSNSSQIHDTGILQEGCLATGGVDKHFFMQKSVCDCRKKQGEVTTDLLLRKIETRYCGTPADSTMDWAAMPDFGIEQKLPLFLGVLSHKSPKSLDAALTNWEQHAFADLGLSGTFVQLNARSEEDDAVIAKHKSAFDFHITGSPDQNIHPGLAIARFCREAERSPHGHPNGENLLLFLEKDWHVCCDGRRLGYLQTVLDSMNTLMQRGVPYVRLTSVLTDVLPTSLWQCDAQGMTWDCTTAHKQRYTNLPSVLRCDWFLRYLEPFAVIEDSIMFGCRRGFRQKKYFDWEEAMQDGRIAWTNSQWVVANYKHGTLFSHKEVDQ